MADETNAPEFDTESKAPEATDEATATDVADESANPTTDTLTPDASQVADTDLTTEPTAVSPDPVGVEGQVGAGEATPSFDPVTAPEATDEAAPEAPASDELAPVEAPASNEPAVTDTVSAPEAPAAVEAPPAPEATEAPEAPAAEADKPAEPADMAGAPTGGSDHGETADVPSRVEAKGEYPVATPAPAVHPCTMMPLVNDGVGEDAGKVADLGATTDAGQAAVAQTNDDKGGTAAKSPDERGEADKGSSSEGHDGKIEHRVGSLMHKVEHIEHMLKKLARALGE